MQSNAVIRTITFPLISFLSLFFLILKNFTLHTHAGASRAAPRRVTPVAAPPRSHSTPPLSNSTEQLTPPNQLQQQQQNPPIPVAGSSGPASNEKGKGAHADGTLSAQLRAQRGDTGGSAADSAQPTQQATDSARHSSSRAAQPSTLTPSLPATPPPRVPVTHITIPASPHTPPHTTHHTTPPIAIPGGHRQSPGELVLAAPDCNVSLCHCVLAHPMIVLAYLLAHSFFTSKPFPYPSQANQAPLPWRGVYQQQGMRMHHLLAAVWGD